MPMVANLFLLLFLADAAVSLLDEVLRAVTGTPSQLLLRQPLALSVILLALVLAILLGLDRRLPKRILLPLVAFALWGGLGFWPLPLTLEVAGLPLLAAILQLLLALAAFAGLRRRGGRWLLAPASSGAPWFSLSYSLKYALVALLLLPLLLGFAGLASVGAYLQQETGGFLQLTPGGIYLQERVYRRGEKTIRLTAMIHLGRREYYRELAQSVGAGRTLILLEGVSDRDRLLQQSFDYSGFAELLGLVAQNSLDFAGQPISLDSLEQEIEPAGDPAMPHLLDADLDLNRFDARTIEFLKVVGRTLLNPEAKGFGLSAYRSWAAAHMDGPMLQVLMADILHRRNRHLVRILQQSLPHYDTLVVPWGAMHMPAIEQAVLQLGFRPESQLTRLSFTFSQLPVRRIFFALTAGLGGDAPTRVRQ